MSFRLSEDQMTACVSESQQGRSQNKRINSGVILGFSQPDPSGFI